ncbi:type II secretion system protein GspH [Sphingomonas oleivorans]|uniref:Type II secretion system protein GspH n=1 Tax=Sphingomonas oleivorans TaxID=1735121 RepID=A0A2T5FVQ3_9SPHN|nr:prepilin-type N-terminal cleavage/methylation domain-containing protein [Sphingomonas oleivorans]PTQ09850.1 type II secretion system protein GspH [Sphingomonas oleivorans]
MPARGGETGMTLVEMLVVLAIIGVMASATVLGMGAASRGANVAAEAQRLASRLRLAADDVMVSDRPIALSWNARGYAFLAWDGRGWRPGSGESYAPHQLPTGISLDMGQRSGPLPIGVDGAGLPFAARLKGPRESWTVAYDGLNVSVTPVPAT